MELLMFVFQFRSKYFIVTINIKHKNVKNGGKKNKFIVEYIVLMTIDVAVPHGRQ